MTTVTVQVSLAGCFFIPRIPARSRTNRPASRPFAESDSTVSQPFAEPTPHALPAFAARDSTAPPPFAEPQPHRHAAGIPAVRVPRIPGACLYGSANGGNCLPLELAGCGSVESRVGNGAGGSVGWRMRRTPFYPLRIHRMLIVTQYV